MKWPRGRVALLWLLAACAGDEHERTAQDAAISVEDAGQEDASEAPPPGEADASVEPRDASAPVDASAPDARAREDASSRADAQASDDAATRPDASAPDAGPASSPGGMGVAPMSWQEHWFEHDRNLKLVAQNDWVVLYFDDEVSRTQTTWLLPFLTRVWQYTVAQYGQFTDGKRDGRLYAIYHQGRFSGGHPSTYFDASHDYRNVSDVGPGPYPEGSYAISTHEVAHVVEGASRGMHGSPAFGVWGDSKWAEFYQYDLYVALGMSAEAERVQRDFTRKSDSFPRANTFWFRDWFYPLWKEHGGVRVMVRYFELLAQHYRRNGVRYGRGMNFGEFVHFMSGAAGVNLKERATMAFGWPDAREAELVQARKDFPGVSY